MLFLLKKKENPVTFRFEEQQFLSVCGCCEVNDEEKMLHQVLTFCHRW